jgi:ubiquinol-cytochrome c reductase cytochrome c1 subunit
MKKLILILILMGLAVPAASLAAGPSVKVDKADIDVTNQASLQRGAKYFVNYCMGCHEAQYSRYARVGQDLGLTEDQVRDNLIFTRDAQGDPTRVGDLMKNAFPEGDAEEAFHIPPPDLTLVARVRGEDWLYTFLRGFYLDKDRPFGVNNTVFSNVSMPHALWDLQGWQEKVTETDARGNEVTRLEVTESGSLSRAEYDAVVRDIVTFLSYLGEPIQHERKVLGIWVMLFLGLFTVIAYLLKKEYWKDIH